MSVGTTIEKDNQTYVTQGHVYKLGIHPYCLLHAALRGRVRFELPPGQAILFHEGDVRKLIRQRAKVGKKAGRPAAGK
jgi:hypothetical protein